MRIKIGVLVSFKGLEEALTLLRRIDANVTKQGVFNMTIADDFADLQAKVAANTTVEQSAVTLLQGLKAQLDALASQPSISSADIKALSDQLASSDADLAAAITANTPAAPPP